MKRDQGTFRLAFSKIFSLLRRGSKIYLVMCETQAIWRDIKGLCVWAFFICVVSHEIFSIIFVDHPPFKLLRILNFKVGRINQVSHCWNWVLRILFWTLLSSSLMRFHGVIWLRACLDLIYWRKNLERFSCFWQCCQQNQTLAWVLGTLRKSTFSFERHFPSQWAT